MHFPAFIGEDRGIWPGSGHIQSDLAIRTKVRWSYGGPGRHEGVLIYCMFIAMYDMIPKIEVKSKQGTDPSTS